MNTDSKTTETAVSATSLRPKFPNIPRSEWTEKTAPKAPITQWKPKRDKSDLYSEADGRVFIFHFEKFDLPDKVATYDRFFVNKLSYGSQLPTICSYINYFIKKYDLDHEIPTAYLKLKFSIDKLVDEDTGLNVYNEGTMDQFISLIYEVMFTPTVVDKIKRLVEDNYLDNIESTDNSRYLKDSKKHLESLEFRNIHVKVMLRISFGMKLIAPVMCHFFYVNHMKPERDSDVIYNFYSRLFDLFNEPGMSLYNKLFVYVKAKVLENKSHNTVIFEQREILGWDGYVVINSFLRKVLISETIIKYTFSEHYSPKTKKYQENIIGFNKTIIKYQLMYFLKEQYAKNMTEVTSTKNTDGLSGQDKMEMNLTKIDEGMVVIADANISSEIERLRREIDFDITDDEIKYYVKNHSPSPLQVQMVYSYWAKDFGVYRNMSLASRVEYTILMLILKKRLLINAGNSEDSVTNTCALAYIISGNVNGTVNTRQIRKSRFVDKVEKSALYKDLCENKYSQLISIRPEYIKEILSKFINTSFTYVVYEAPDLLGQPIEYDEDTISDELLFFLKSI